MNKPFFFGVCTALVTPFLHGKIHDQMLDQLITRQLDSGIDTLVISGTTGESPTLSDTEKIHLFKQAKRFSGSHARIIAGTGSNNTMHAVSLSCEAEAAGADALLLVSPYYNKATPDGLVEHFGLIASNVSIPIILYNVPSRTGVDIPVNVYRQLAEIPNICGVKEASTDITKITKIRAACPPSFSIWTGNDAQIVPAISLGGNGVISVLSNILPKETKRMANAALCGNYQTAAELQIRLDSLIDALFAEVNPIPVKAAMKLIGYECGEGRLPLSKISPEALKKLEKALSSIGSYDILK